MGREGETEEPEFTRRGAEFAEVWFNGNNVTGRGKLPGEVAGCWNTDSVSKGGRTSRAKEGQDILDGRLRRVVGKWEPRKPSGCATATLAGARSEVGSCLTSGGGKADGGTNKC